MDGTTENFQPETCRARRIPVRKVLALAADNLGREDLVRAVNDCAGEPFGEAASLLRCYNLIENEVALDYFPLHREECVCACGGTIGFSRLAFAPVRIISVRDERGEVPFELRPAQIVIAGGGERRYTVTYSYSPREKEICEDSEFGGRISARLLSFGVACEFCLSNGQFSEAAVWEKRYRDAIRAANILRRPLSVRARRWV